MGMTRVAFQGVHGAYSELAARFLIDKGGKTAGGAHTIPCESFDEVFRSVERGSAQRGVIPIENSLAGSIHQNYDLLLKHGVHITGELHLRVEHVLMAGPGTSMKSLHTVRSHPQALAQCSRFFETHPGIRPEAFFDTAGAALSLRGAGTAGVGAIASAYAAELYGLTVLRRNLENEPHNFTRFLLIARSPWKLRGGTPTKCSIAFRPASNTPGILFRILGVFSLRDIDLLKIESRPDPASPFEYLFYLDLAGSPREPRVERALAHLQEVVTHYRLLGAYPMGSGRVYGAIKKRNFRSRRK